MAVHDIAATRPHCYLRWMPPCASLQPAYPNLNEPNTSMNPADLCRYGDGVKYGLYYRPGEAQLSTFGNVRHTLQ